MLSAFVDALGHNDVTAYLTMMAPRLVALRKVLKPTGSIYLHCDPTAGHYLKVLMDAVFGPRNFVNEIIWKRSDAHSDARQGARHFGRIHDSLLLYAADQRQMRFNTLHTPLPESTAENWYRYVEEGTGRRYNRADLTAAKPGGDTSYEWQGVRPPRGRYWAYSRANMERLQTEGRIVYTRSGRPYMKRYLDESRGVALQDVWADISMLRGISRDGERLGYATQKPEALLERIVEASSNPGDLVLDPFCGCGTATVAAHRLGREWIGIDVTYLAVDLMKRRLLDTFPKDFPDGVHVDGEPADEAGALALARENPLQFQYWAVAKLDGTQTGGARPLRGADRGIDGTLTFPERDPNDAEKPTLDHKPVIISVKGGQRAGVGDLRDLRGTVEREDAAIGVMVLARQRTAAMEKEAAAAGLYHSPWDGSTYPRIQIITAGEIIHGERIEMPSQRSASDFTRAPVARERAEQPPLV